MYQRMDNAKYLPKFFGGKKQEYLTMDFKTHYLFFLFQYKWVSTRDLACDTQARMGLGLSFKISCAVLVPEEFVISLRILRKPVKSGHNRPAAKRHPNVKVECKDPDEKY